MNVYWSIPYKTVTFCEENDRKTEYVFSGFPQIEEQWIV